MALAPCEASAQPGEGVPAVPLPPRGGDGTLLAIVPIPGTRTSLAIVGYLVTEYRVGYRFRPSAG